MVLSWAADMVCGCKIVARVLEEIASSHSPPLVLTPVSEDVECEPLQLCEYLSSRAASA